MRFHEEALPAAQRRALRTLGPAMAHRGFCLGGEAGVALRRGHRRSVDLVWFTERPLGDALALVGQLQEEGIGLQPLQMAPGTLHGQLGGIPVTMLEYRYQLLQPPEERPAYGCLVASLDDLTSMKLSTVAQRGSKKDFVDVYALGVGHCPLGQMLEPYRRKYGIEDVAHVLYGLAYFEDAEQERMPNMLWRVGRREIKRAIQTWVKALAT